jgi:hypothetical protein
MVNGHDASNIHNDVLHTGGDDHAIIEARPFLVTKLWNFLYLAGEI